MKSKTFLLLITSVSALGGFLFGYDTGVINGAQYFLSQHFDLDPALKGWVVGSALIGCLVGALSAGYLSMKIGRKYSLIISAALFTISAWGSGLPSFLPDSVSLLVVFRIIGGLGIGIASMSAPMYIAEIAPSHRRGTLVTFYQLAIVIGFFVVFLVTYFIGDKLSVAENISFGWRRMFWSELIPSSLFLVLLFFVPKSPRWLYLMQRPEEGYGTLLKIHGSELAKIEAHQIQDSIDQNLEKPKVNFFSKAILGIILIGTIFSMLQQFTGINAVLYYGSDIFEKALGFGKDDVIEQQILLAFINLIFTFIAMFSVDKFGRKPLVYIGCVGMIIGFSLLGISLQQQSVGLVSLIGVLLFIASFAMSMGPVVWVLLSEMFPNRIRSAAMSIAVAAQWASNYVVSQFFPVVSESETNMNSFWNGSLPYFIFIGFIILIIVFTYKFLPETKNKSLEELEDIWD
ncbi:D-xylose proton-symporter XylE [Psychroflexus torquis ATCC 700755]|uniref:D-xylose proton-symporter XylE n=1 Tax=Psychroflexus torquis (strain ATCC 700755 / CIP 106069 / ACAM 623) TaxID=313595 RepID=K4ICY3_PSYTT|nr:sugar porter family MFS transporter [Psychroflexus torquis]AFU68447.1 D-xylose proton-symporter XylE [Psychroflexus torquis ATCC 700755]